MAKHPEDPTGAGLQRLTEREAREKAQARPWMAAGGVLALIGFILTVRGMDAAGPGSGLPPLPILLWIGGMVIFVLGAQKMEKAQRTARMRHAIERGGHGASRPRRPRTAGGKPFAPPRCPQCDGIHPRNAVTCRHCGTALQAECQACGAMNSISAGSCRACGAPIQEAEEA
jgi:ribosomal protein L40E